MDCSATKAALREAKELVQAFGKRSTCVPGAIFKLENIFNKLQPQVRQMKRHSVSVLHSLRAQTEYTGQQSIDSFMH